MTYIPRMRCALGSWLLGAAIVAGCSADAGTRPAHTAEVEEDTVADVESDVPEIVPDVAVADAGDPAPVDAAPAEDAEVACTPQCDGKACGDDGCGGLCGKCVGGGTCTADGTCKAPPDPICHSIGTLGCGDKASGAVDGPGSTDVVDAVSCVSYDYSGPEMAWTLDAPPGTTVSAKVTTADDEDDEIDVAILASTSGVCSGDDCEAQSQTAASVTTEAGTTYFALVQGFKGAVKDFELSVSCCTPSCNATACGDDGCGGVCGKCKGNEVCEAGACKAPTFDGNDTCATATAITVLPFAASGTTVGAKDDTTHSGDVCGDGQQGGLDVVFAYTATAKETLSAWLDDYGFGAPKILYVMTGCADKTACVAEMDFITVSPGDALHVAVSAGVTYYFIVDGYDGQEKGAYGLHVSNP